jgi:hypothetical protein
MGGALVSKDRIAHIHGDEIVIGREHFLLHRNYGGHKRTIARGLLLQAVNQHPGPLSIRPTKAPSDAVCLFLILVLVI